MTAKASDAREALQRLVHDCVQQARARRRAAAVDFLRLNARLLERRLRALDHAAAHGLPAGEAMAGLSALDISDAMERLDAEARRLARTGPRSR